MGYNLIERVNALALILCMILVNILYLPTVIYSTIYGRVTLALFFCIGVSLLCHLRIFLHKFILYYIFIATTFLIFATIAILACKYDTYFTISADIFLSLSIFAVGYSCGISSSEFMRGLCWTFIISATIMGLISVYEIIGGFKILDYYAIFGKNSSGVLLATAAVLSLILLTKASSLKTSIVLFAIFIVLVNCLLVFRARASITSLAVCTVIFFYKSVRGSDTSKKTKYFLWGTVLVVIVAVLSGYISLYTVYDSLTRNRDVEDANSLSTGRMDQIKNALALFIQSPGFGALALNKAHSFTDCFPVNIMGRYGIFGMLSIYPYYLLVWYIALKGIITKSVKQGEAYYALMILLIVSFFEATYPFSPGSGVFCAYLLLGISLRQEKDGY